MLSTTTEAFFCISAVTLDTYTHVTTDMQKKASAVVGNMMKNFKIGD